MLTLVILLTLTLLLSLLVFWGQAKRKQAQDSSHILLIEIPYNNSEDWQQKAIALMEHLHKGISNLNTKAPVAFEISRYFGQNIQFYIKAPQSTLQFIKQTIEAIYPHSNVIITQDHLVNLKNSGQKLYLAHLNIEPEVDLQKWLNQTYDNLSAVFKVFLALDPSEALVLQYTAIPTKSASNSVLKGLLKYPVYLRIILLPLMSILWAIGKTAGALSTTSEEQTEASTTKEEQEEPPPSAQYFVVTTRSLVATQNQVRAESIFNALNTALVSTQINSKLHVIPRGNKNAINQFVKRTTITNPIALLFAKEFESFSVLDHIQLAYAWHIPFTEESREYNFDMANIKLMPPKNLPDPRKPNVTFIGITNYRGKNKVFGIKDKDIRRHFYIIGKSGSGKTTLLKTMIVDDINKGKGVAVIDPHGDLAKDIISYIPEHRVQDTVYFNVSDTQFPMAYNPVYLHEEEKPQKDLIADAILGIFKKMFDSWGPRLEYLLYNMILTVLEVKGTTLVSIQKMLVDKTYRNKIIKQVQDPALIQFWRREFAKMEKNKNELQQALSPIQNKVGRFVTPPTIRNIIGQNKNKIKLRQVIDNNQIFIANLSKGLIGEENASLLGSMLVTNFYFAALSRANIAESERHTFRLYIDEMQNFVTDAFENILSEARKYGLGLILAHQFLDQLPENIQKSILGNVGSLVTFTVGNQDAKVLADEFAPLLTPEALVRLDKYEAYVKLLIDSSISKPFSAKTVPVELVYKKHNMEGKIIEHSRSLYATPKEEVEEKLGRWLKAGL